MSGGFQLIRVYAFRDSGHKDLGGHASVEMKMVDGDLTLMGHPGSYVLLIERNADKWITPTGEVFDRFEVTTMRLGDGKDD